LPLSNIDDSNNDLPEFNEVISVYTSAWPCFMHPATSAASGVCIGNASGPYLPGEEKALNMIASLSIPTQHRMESEASKSPVSGLFVSFKFWNILYPCALVRWYAHNKDEDTGMWVVEPDSHPDGFAFTAVIHLNNILRAAHLIPVFGQDTLPTDIPLAYSLDVFNSYYVNKYIGHHAFEIAF
jgi:hypothetical protein